MRVEAPDRTGTGSRGRRARSGLVSIRAGRDYDTWGRKELAAGETTATNTLMSIMVRQHEPRTN